jgi:hypothetical protein
MAGSTQFTSAAFSVKLDSLIERFDKLEERTQVLEKLQTLITTVCDHETILRGPDRNDGLITQMIALNSRIETQEKRVNEIVALIKAIMIPLVTTLIISIGGFVWGLLTNSIILTLGK